MHPVFSTFLKFSEITRAISTFLVTLRQTQVHAPICFADNLLTKRKGEYLPEFSTEQTERHEVRTSSRQYGPSVTRPVKKTEGRYSPWRLVNKLSAKQIGA